MNKRKVAFYLSFVSILLSGHIPYAKTETSSPNFPFFNIHAYIFFLAVLLLISMSISLAFVIYGVYKS